MPLAASGLGVKGLIRAGLGEVPNLTHRLCILVPRHTHPGPPVRTNIVIDDALLEQAQKLTGARTKREAVDTALRLLVQIKRQEGLRAARGKLRWEGDLDAMRRDT